MRTVPASRMGPLAAISGAVLLLVGTYLHPSSADPNIPSEAFAEYAAARGWVTIHLLQLLGVILIVTALVLLSRQLADGPAGEWATLGMAGAIGSLAVASALQAVDGIALKVMVDSWAGAPEPEKITRFQAAFAVRRIEIGLASMTGLLFGLTALIFGIALWLDRRLPRWMGVVAIVGGPAVAAAGVLFAYMGFSRLAMDINMPSSSLLILWLILMGIDGLRR